MGHNQQDTPHRSALCWTAMFLAIIIAAVMIVFVLATQSGRTTDGADAVVVVAYAAAI